MIVSMGEGKQCVALKLIGRGKADHPDEGLGGLFDCNLANIGAVGTGYVPGVDMP